LTLRIDNGLFQVAPNGKRPANIVVATANHMDMQLADLIAYAGDVYFLALVLVLDKAAQVFEQLQHMLCIGIAKVMDFRVGAYRDEDKPGQTGVSVQQQVTIPQAAQPVAILLQALMRRW